MKITWTQCWIRWQLFPGIHVTHVCYKHDNIITGLIGSVTQLQSGNVTVNTREFAKKCWSNQGHKGPFQKLNMAGKRKYIARGRRGRGSKGSFIQVRETSAVKIDGGRGSKHLSLQCKDREFPQNFDFFFPPEFWCRPYFKGSKKDTFLGWNVSIFTIPVIPRFYPFYARTANFSFFS